jgi:hypothetical protein
LEIKIKTKEVSESFLEKFMKYDAIIISLYMVPENVDWLIKNNDTK